MPVIHAPETAYAQEMRKWEANYTKYGPPGRPWGSEGGPGGHFPNTVFKATRQPDGKRIMETFVVQNEDEERNMQSRGWVLTQQEALDALDAAQTEHAKLAAEINAEARRMSPQAQEEIAAAQEAAGARHLPSIPETPKKRLGRPAKVKAEIVTEGKGVTHG
jgi:hypothetical protein